MMPSRGLRLPNGAAPSRLYNLQCRNLSSTPSTRTSLQTRTRSRPTTAFTSQRWQGNGLTGAAGMGAMSMGGVRNASWWNPLGWGQSKSQPPTPVDLAAQSTPASTPASASLSDHIASAKTTSTPAAEPATIPVPTNTPSESQLPTLDSISLDDLGLTQEAAKVTEHIGYLQELGLDFGWGPTTTMQYFLEHLHVSGGLPWWASIVTLAVSARIILIPLYIKGSDAQARQAALAPIMNPLTQRMKQCRAAGDSEGAQLVMQQMRQVQKAGGFGLLDALWPAVGQGVIGYSMFRLLSACATHQVPGFEDGGLLWLKDLTVSDPFLLLPALMAGSLHLLQRFGGESGASATSALGPQGRALLLYLMPGLVFIMMGYQSGAVCIWFASTGLLSMVQMQVLRNPTVREKLGIAPLYKPKAGEKPSNPFDAILGNVDDANPSNKPVASQPRDVKLNWQAPNIGGQPKTINANASSVSAEASNGNGILEKTKTQLGKPQRTFQQLKDALQTRKERVAQENRLAAEKRRAEEYERKASQRGR